MNKQIEALKLARTALQEVNYDQAYAAEISAIDDALADSALERMAENERELGLDYMEPVPPPECKTDAEKTAFAFGWWKALEENRKQSAQQQEPVAVYVGETWCGSVVSLYEDLPLETPLYTSPQPAQQQEPVAEVKLMERGGNAGLATVIHEIFDPMREPLRVGDKLYTSPQPAQQEPVGKWMGDCIEWTENPYKFRKGQPIYTSPPASKPLTDEQINLFINGRGEEGDDDYVEPTGDGFGLTDADLVRLVRRVEAAHGIKEDA